MRINLGEQAQIGIASASISDIGEFTMTIRGYAGWNYRIEISDDLVNWTLLREVQSAGAVTEFRDTELPGELNKFYRAIRK